MIMGIMRRSLKIICNNFSKDLKLVHITIASAILTGILLYIAPLIVIVASSIVISRLLWEHYKINKN